MVNSIIKINFREKLLTVDKIMILTVSAVICTLYLWHLGFYPLFNPDEGRYAEISREMIASGDFLTPHLNGVEYFEKPVLQYWITAVFMLLFGENEFAVRLFPALCALGGIFCTYYTGVKMFDRKTGGLAAVILATSLLYLIIGSLSILDMAVSFFITVCIIAFYQFSITKHRVFIYIFYACMALGILTKGLIAIILPAGVIVIYTLSTKQLDLLQKFLSPAGIGIFLFISVPWFYLVCRENPDFFYFFFIHEHFMRYLTTVHNRYEPFYFFVPCIILGIFPWTGFIFSFLPLKTLWKKQKFSIDLNKYIYLGLWFGVIFIFYSLSDSKLIPYIVPCLVPLAVLTADYLRQAVKNKKDIKIPLIINAFISVLIIAALSITAVKNDFISIQEFIRFGSPMILILLIMNVSNLILWFKNRNINQIICISVTASILLCFSLQPLITETAKHRTGKEVAQAVNLWKNPDTLIVCYQDYLQDLPFYTKSRIALCDYYDELKFGSQHPDGQGWFLSKNETKDLWQKQNNIILVVSQKHKIDCLKTLNIDLNSTHYREFEKYIIIKH